MGDWAINKKNITNFHLKNAIHRGMKSSIKMHRCGIVMNQHRKEIRRKTNAFVFLVIVKQRPIQDVILLYRSLHSTMLWTHLRITSIRQFMI